MGATKQASARDGVGRNVHRHPWIECRSGHCFVSSMIVWCAPQSLLDAALRCVIGAGYAPDALRPSAATHTSYP
jgi:hypothetical protein